MRRSETTFAFQVAQKNGRVEPPLASPWGSLLIESLRENLASKMGALVGRGAPRALLDVATLVDRGLVKLEDCWAVWESKPRPVDRAAAGCAVLRHLHGLELRRPLETIAAPDERARAAHTRQLIRDLCNA